MTPERRAEILRDMSAERSNAGLMGYWWGLGENDLGERDAEMTLALSRILKNEKWTFYNPMKDVDEERGGSSKRMKSQK